MNFRIQGPQGGAKERPDDYLPHAQTCFFSLSLPRCVRGCGWLLAWVLDEERRGHFGCGRGLGYVCVYVYVCALTSPPARMAN